MFYRITLFIFAFLLSPIGANAAGDITAAGKVISSAGGFEFPDGSIQTTAATASENHIIVATSGGDFSSVAAALNSITTNGSSNPYHIWVGPGVYTETETLHVKGYVHLQGSGPNVTRIESNVNGGSEDNADSWAAMLHDNGRISDLTLVNNGIGGTVAVGVGMSGVTDSAVLDNVDIQTVGLRKTGIAGSNIAVYVKDGGPRILNSRLTAYGYGSELSGSYALFIAGDGVGDHPPQPVIRNSNLYAGKEPASSSERASCAGDTLSGSGIFSGQAAPLVYNSVICGDWVALYTRGPSDGIIRIHNSVIKSSTHTNGSGIDASLTYTGDHGSILFKGSELWASDARLGNHLSTNEIHCVLSTNAAIDILNPDCTGL